MAHDLAESTGAPALAPAPAPPFRRAAVSLSCSAAVCGLFADPSTVVAAEAESRDRMPRPPPPAAGLHLCDSGIRCSMQNSPRHALHTTFAPVKSFFLHRGAPHEGIFSAAARVAFARAHSPDRSCPAKSTFSPAPEI